MVDNADLLASMIVDHGAAPAIVVGHSYGGGIAILLAARRPDLVAGVVLVASVGSQDSVGTFDHVLALPGLGEAISAASLFTLSRVLPGLRSLANNRHDDSWEWLRASIPDQHYGRGLWSVKVWRSFVAEQRFLVREIDDVGAALAEVKVPTVVLAGTWDVVVPPTAAATIARAIPGAQLQLVARLGHFVPRHAPEVVAEAVRQVERRIVEKGERLDVEESAGS